MKARYYICVGGKWMRLRLRVDGPVLVGQRARPVFLARCGGNLCVLPPVEVSRELTAHAAGAPSRARSGPILPLMRPVRRRHQCRWRRRANEIAFRLAFSERWSRTADTWAIGLDTEDKENVVSPSHKNIDRKRDIFSPKSNSVQPSPQKFQSPQKPLTSEKLPEHISNRGAPSQVHISLKDIDDNPAAVATAPKVTVKELVICGESVTIFGHWAVSDPMASLILGEVDEVRFDRDPNYRNLLLYKLQPLVKLNRNSHLDNRLLRASQDEFAAVLGLVPSAAVSPVSKPAPPVARPRRSAVRLQQKRNKGSEEESPYVIKKPFREFSSLEDAAIVRWVCAHGAERRVNGNTIWKELQPRYKELTGTHRSWHSLRNRYLRHILPSLPHLGLAPDVACRLRSAAALGELKLKSKGAKKSKNNSLLQKHVPAAAPSAHAAARKHRSRQLSSSLEDAPPHRRHGKPTPKKVTQPKQKSKVEDSSPTYSELTRAFAARHRRSRNTPSPEDAAAAPTADVGRVTRRLYNPGRTL